MRLLLTFLLLLLVSGGVSAESTEYLASNGVVGLRSSEEFRKTFNPHALLSLQTPDEIVVLVTSQEQRFTLTELYDGVPSTFGEGAECKGRVLLSVDGEDAAVFLVEGMFPPEEESTHSTVYAVVNRGEEEYTIMIHYPIDMGDEGFEWAAELLAQFYWV